jgi:hypothetical protein
MPITSAPTVSLADKYRMAVELKGAVAAVVVATEEGSGL